MVKPALVTAVTYGSSAAVSALSGSRTTTGASSYGVAKVTVTWLPAAGVVPVPQETVPRALSRVEVGAGGVVAAAGRRGRGGAGPRGGGHRRRHRRLAGEALERAIVSALRVDLPGSGD